MAEIIVYTFNGHRVAMANNEVNMHNALVEADNGVSVQTVEDGEMSISDRVEDVETALDMILEGVTE